MRFIGSGGLALMRMPIGRVSLCWRSHGTVMSVNGQRNNTILSCISIVSTAIVVIVNICEKEVRDRRDSREIIA